MRRKPFAVFLPQVKEKTAQGKQAAWGGQLQGGQPQGAFRGRDRRGPLDRATRLEEKDHQPHHDYHDHRQTPCKQKASQA